MPFTNPPPIRADALEFTHDRQGRLVSAKFSQSWLRWFASFREQVEAVAALSLAELQDELGALSQDNVNSIGAAAFGDDYKGAWSARTHNVGNVRSYEGRYYRCIVARLAANVETPDNDPQGWELSGSAANLSLISQNNVEAIGAATFADAYKGKWAAGVHAVGDVRSYLLRYYECLVARVAADIGNPTVDVTSWDLAGSAITIKANVQENIDAVGYANYGLTYTGKWAAGVHARGSHVSRAGRYYECLVARDATDTDNPSVDNVGWDAVGTSLRLQGDIATAKQENIDAAGAIVFGEDYTGKWIAGVHVIGEVTYDDVTEKFYECDVARVATDTDRPSDDIASWTSIVMSQVGVYTARDRAATTLPETAREGDMIWVIGGVGFGDWGIGRNLPSGATTPRGIAVKENGDILIVDDATNKVYTYSAGIWDSGVDVPAGETSPTGIAVTANDDILIVGLNTRKVYKSTDDGATWDAGVDVPAGETSPTGIAVTANDDILIVGLNTRKVYKSTDDGATWDAGVDVPAGETSPTGIAVKENGDWVIAGTILKKVFTRSLGIWDSGVDVPAGETSPQGIAVTANGDLVIVGTLTDLFYLAYLLRAVDRYVWYDGRWQLSGIREVGSVRTTQVASRRLTSYQTSYETERQTSHETERTTSYFTGEGQRTTSRTTSYTTAFDTAGEGIARETSHTTEYETTFDTTFDRTTSRETSHTTEYETTFDTTFDRTTSRETSHTTEYETTFDTTFDRTTSRETSHTTEYETTFDTTFDRTTSRTTSRETSRETSRDTSDEQGIPFETIYTTEYTTIYQTSVTTSVTRSTSRETSRVTTYDTSVTTSVTRSTSRETSRVTTYDTSVTTSVTRSTSRETSHVTTYDTGVTTSVTRSTSRETSHVTTYDTGVTRSTSRTTSRTTSYTTGTGHTTSRSTSYETSYDTMVQTSRETSHFTTIE